MSRLCDLGLGSTGRDDDLLAADEPVFLDRNHRVFHSVLLFLREAKDGNAVTNLAQLAVHPPDIEPLLAEARFFRIAGLVKLLEQQMAKDLKSAVPIPANLPPAGHMPAQTRITRGA